MLQKILSRFKKKQNRNSLHISKKKRQLQLNTSFRKRKRRIILHIVSHLFFSLKSTKKIFLLLSVLIGIGFIIIFILFGPIFKVQKIFISREDTLININKAYGDVENIRGDNILFLDANTIASRLQKGQSAIEKISLQTKFPHTLNIKLKSYTPIFQNGKYLILSNGSVIENSSSNFTNLPFLILSKDIEQLSIFKEKINIIELQHIQKLLNDLPKNIIGFKPTVLQYYIDEKEFLISHDTGTIFLFDLNGDSDLQIKQLAVFQKEGTNILGNKYIYIDARIQKKLFLCPLENEFDCRNNLKNIYGPSVFTKKTKVVF